MTVREWWAAMCERYDSPANVTRKVTRLEVIDEQGRAFVQWNCRVDASVQDNGRTLKLFVAGAIAEQTAYVEGLEKSIRDAEDAAHEVGYPLATWYLADIIRDLAAKLATSRTSSGVQ